MRLELNENFGTVVTSKFRNFISSKFTEGDNCVCTWNTPLLSFDIYKEILTIDEYQYLISFFDAVKGSAGSFRYQDPTDYKGDYLLTTNELGFNTTAGELYPNPDGVRTTFQMVKLYRIDADNEVFRSITKPVQGTIVLFSGIGHSINYETGVVAFVSPPSADAVNKIQWEGEFDVVVSFESDVLPIKLITEDNGYAYYKLEQMKLVEQRESLPMYYSSLATAPMSNITIPFNSDRELSYKTLSYQSDAGFTFKKALRLNPIQGMELAETNLLTRHRTEYAILLWRVRFGNALPFMVEDMAGNTITVRFDMEELSITVVSEPSKGSEIYRITGMSVVQPLYASDSISYYCHLFEITRADNQVFRFTDFSSLLEIGGNTYHPNSGINPTATSAKLNEDRDNITFASIVSDLITEADLLSGAWNNAFLTVKVYNWRSYTQRILFSGYLGELTVGYEVDSVRRFSFESLGVQNKLARKWSQKTSYLCRHSFGDQTLGSCRYDFSHLIVNTSVTSVGSNGSLSLSVNLDASKQYYEKYGYILFTTGKNKGSRGLIKSVNGTQIVFWHGLPYRPSIGDAVQVYPGCEKSTEFCSQKYGNIVNYGGFPLLPGYDILSTIKK